ncbi:MAG: hypothetical protein KIT34_18930 [Cyanobacteria bacterium TGS_CYA1]|nr:hypothetical protein [Cyanobacteria bacterium TGS_CYA1]
MTETDELIKCSFCGNTEDQSEKIICGPGVFICYACVQLCNEIVNDSQEKKDKIMSNLHQHKKFAAEPVQQTDFVTSHSFQGFERFMEEFLQAELESENPKVNQNIVALIERARHFRQRGKTGLAQILYQAAFLLVSSSEFTSDCQ